MSGMITKMKTGRSPADPDSGETTEEEKSPGSKTSYECRFCLMRFEKSQALGGHMNRHRQEREKEQYQQAQQLLNSLAQQQMPRNWPLLAPAATEIPQLHSDPPLSRMSSQSTGGATRPHAPLVSFNSFRGQAPTSASNLSVPSSSLSSNYFVPSNSSSCNNNVQQQQQQQQQQQNLHLSGDGYSAATTPRSAPQPASYRAVETTRSTSLQATGVPPEVFASMFRASTTNHHHHNNSNNNDSSLVSSGTPTNTAQGPYDLYSSYSPFYGGM